MPTKSTCKFFLLVLIELGFFQVPAIRAEKSVRDLLDKAKKVAQKSQTLSADFSYITVRPVGESNSTTEIHGKVKLMKPNFADIHYNPQSAYGRRIISDGTHIWNMKNQSREYQKTLADSEGRNINVWRLITIGGFFDLDYWLESGVYVHNVNDLTYVGQEEVEGVDYEVMEHRMMGTIQGQSCPFHQKLYFGPEGLISRFTLDFTLDGKPGSELAELKNLKLGIPLQVKDFRFEPPKDFYELPTIAR